MGVLPRGRRIPLAGIVAGVFALGSALAAATAPESQAALTAPASHAAANLAAQQPAVLKQAGAAVTATPDVIVRSGTHLAGALPTTTPPAGYSPSDLRSAYDLATAASSGGQGATVAIVGAFDDPTAASDLAVYRSQFKLPACTATSGCFTKVNENGQSSPLPSSQATVWSDDEAVDLDMVSAICPNCHLLLVETASTSAADLGTGVDSAVRLGAKYVVLGFVTSPFLNVSYDTPSFNHPGVAITAPGEDAGYEQSVSDSAANFLPFVTSVGGTTLRKASNTRGWTETAWAYGESGCAQNFGKPSWETDTGCAGRTVNDVAAVSDPATGVAFYTSANGSAGWATAGGTTVAASIVGAVYALAGVPGADTYPASYPSLHTGNLYPVTSGSNLAANGSCAPSYLCTAGPAYNGPAGWGTPDGTAAFTTPAADTVAMAGPGRQRSVLLPAAVSLQVYAQDSAGQALTYTATGLPPGVSIDAGTGLISGAVTADYAGTAAVTATDANGATATVSIPWQANHYFQVVSLANQQTEPNTQVTLPVSVRETDKDATVAFAAGGLPPGLAIDPGTGVISGTTGTTIGSYDVTVTGTDSTGKSSTIAFAWHVWNQITVTAPSSAVRALVGDPVHVALSATDSAPGLSLSYASTALPPGLSLDAETGVISGAPTALADTTVPVTVTDGTGSEAGLTIGWLIGGAITVGNPGKPVTDVGRAVDLALRVHDSAASDQLSYTATGLPPGVSIAAGSPVISGWPTKTGPYQVRVTVTGLDGGTASVTFPLVVRAAPGTGPAGPVQSGAHDKCLTDAANSVANGTAIQVWTCDGRAAQRWTFAIDGTLRLHGKCLTVVGNPISPGAKLQLWPCTGAATQRWTLTLHARLVPSASYLCLSDSDRTGMKNGARVVLEPCGYRNWSAAVPTQGWVLPVGPVLSGIPGRCLDDYHGVRSAAAKIDVAPCNGGDGQRWQFRPDDTIRIFGLCLTRNGGNGTAGSHVMLRNCTGAASQKWTVGPMDFANEIASHTLDPAPPASLAATPALAVLTAQHGPGNLWHIW